MSNCLSVQKFQPDSFGAPGALATYHGILGDFDAIADWLSKAIGQHDPAILSMLRLWYGRDLHNTPRWATVIAQTQPPRSLSPAHGSHTGSSDIRQWEPRIDCENFEIA